MTFQFQFQNYALQVKCGDMVTQKNANHLSVNESIDNTDWSDDWDGHPLHLNKIATLSSLDLSGTLTDIEDHAENVKTSKLFPMLYEPIDWLPFHETLIKHFNDCPGISQCSDFGAYVADDEDKSIRCVLHTNVKNIFKVIIYKTIDRLTAEPIPHIVQRFVSTRSDVKYEASVSLLTLYNCEFNATWLDVSRCLELPPPKTNGILTSYVDTSTKKTAGGFLKQEIEKIDLFHAFANMEQQHQIDFLNNRFDFSNFKIKCEKLLQTHSVSVQLENITFSNNTMFSIMGDMNPASSGGSWEMWKSIVKGRKRDFVEELWILMQDIITSTDLGNVLQYVFQLVKERPDEVLIAPDNPSKLANDLRNIIAGKLMPSAACLSNNFIILVDVGLYKLTNDLVYLFQTIFPDLPKEVFHFIGQEHSLEYMKKSLEHLYKVFCFAGGFASNIPPQLAVNKIRSLLESINKSELPEKVSILVNFESLYSKYYVSQWSLLLKSCDPCKMEKYIISENDNEFCHLINLVEKTIPMMGRTFKGMPDLAKLSQYLKNKKKSN